MIATPVAFDCASSFIKVSSIVLPNTANCSLTAVKSDIICLDEIPIACPIAANFSTVCAACTSDTPITIDNVWMLFAVSPPDIPSFSSLAAVTVKEAWAEVDNVVNVFKFSYNAVTAFPDSAKEIPNAVFPLAVAFIISLYLEEAPVAATNEEIAASFC